MTPFAKIMLTVSGIARHHGLDPELVIGQSRIKPVVRARQHCFHALRRKGLSYPHIGHFMNRNHSTVMYGIREHEARVVASAGNHEASHA